MKQIYDFERERPPVLNEAMLRRELEGRRVRRSALLILLSGVLLQLALLLFSFLVFGEYPAMALAVQCYVVVSMAGSGAIAIMYVQKGGECYD